MRLAHLAPVLSVGLLAAAAGCYSPYSAPYSTPYGYPSAPIQTLTPGGTYTPTYPQGGPALSPTPADSYSLPGSTYTPNGTNGSGGSPFYNNSTSQPPYNGGVPQPRDPGEVQFQQSKPKPIADGFNLMEQGSIEGAGASTSNVAKVNTDSAEFFQPVRVRGQNAQASPGDGVTTVPGAPSPFAHDAAEYRWLRGVARLNPSTGNWSLVYSTMNPESDRFHGWLTLAADPRLAQLVPNGTFLISGQLDETQTDSAGKPVYRVHSISPWKPSPSF